MGSIADCEHYRLWSSLVYNTGTHIVQGPGVVAESVEHRSSVREIVGLNPWSSQSNGL